MRGKVLHLFQRVGGEGITPAYAGKSDKHQRARSWLGDYPRMCGEKSMTSHAIRAPVGSPPRVRGKGRPAQGGTPATGITPACAGKSPKMICYYYAAGDHPRVCGEKDKAAEKAQHLRGSSPRVRGKAVPVAAVAVAAGITPACAGKRVRRFMWSRPFGDHPRECGEKEMHEEARDTPRGSPPRVRGKGHLLLDGTVSLRITPACAGKSSSHQQATEYQ